MTHNYNLKGLTCTSCVEKVRHALLVMPEVLSADVNRNAAVISMDTHIPRSRLLEAISHGGKFH
jgi:copper chaperone CopZ